MPTWQMRLLIRAAFTTAGPSSMVRLSGFSTNTSLPALSASMAIGTCQWSGVPISTTVDFLVIEQRAVVAERARVGRVLFGLVDLRAPDIAQRGHLHRAGLYEIAHVVAAALAAADQAELHPLVGAVDARVR